MGKKIKVKLFFPDNKTGEVSCGYTTLTVEDHHANLKYDPDDKEATTEARAFIDHWLRNDATIASEKVSEEDEIIVSLAKPKKKRVSKEGDK